MIGVLTVLAILAAVIVPMVFGAIHSAALSQTASSINTAKTACAGHFAQFGSFATDGSVNPPASIPLDGTDPRSAQFDKVLVWETLLDSLFSPKIGDRLSGQTNTRVQVVAAVPATTDVTQDNSAYNLDGNGVNEASGMVVVEAVITGVPLEDAKALNDILDGASLGQDSSGNDFKGRVKYANPASSGSNGSGSGSGGSGGSGNGNGVGLGNGNGNGGNNRGNGNGGSDNGNGNGGNGNGNGNGNAGGSSGGGSTGNSATPNTVTVHIYLTHR